MYFRRLQVGEVIGFKLAKDGTGVSFRIFVRAPYDRFVTAGSRFWNASGVDVALDAAGFRVQTQSLISILLGGIAFQSPPDVQPGPPSEPNTEFTLFANQGEAFEHPDTVAETYLLLFDESVRGLSVGAAVDFRGLVIGEVTAIGLDIDPAKMEIRSPVEIRIYPDRLRARLLKSGKPGRRSHRACTTLCRSRPARPVAQRESVDGPALRGTGFLPQCPEDHPRYDPGLTGRQNLSFFAGAYRMNKRDWRSRLEQCVAACQLAGVLDRPAETYSGGEKRRLNLAIALLNTPRILYLDEPTVGIDARSRQAIVEAIAALKAQGVTIVYTSHYMEEVEQLCDQLMVIDEGRIVALGGKEDLLKQFAPSALVVTLERPVAREGVAALNPVWQDDTHLTVPIASAADLPRVMEVLHAGAAYGDASALKAARLEQAYLAMIGPGDAS